MPIKSTPLALSLRRRLAATTKATSLRALAEQVGCSHFVLWKAIQGKGIKHSSERAIRAFLEEGEGVRAGQFLDRLIRVLATDLGVSRARGVEKALRQVLTTAYGDENREIPSWLVGRKKHIARLQAPRSGGTRASTVQKA